MSATGTGDTTKETIRIVTEVEIGYDSTYGREPAIAYACEKLRCDGLLWIDGIGAIRAKSIESKPETSRDELAGLLLDVLNEGYGDHSPGCLGRHEGRECECGWVKTLAEIKQALGRAGRG